MSLSKKLGAEFFGTSAQQVIKLRARCVVGVGRQVAFDILEAEVEARTAIRDKEGGTRFTSGHGCYTIFDTELAEDRDDARDE